MLLTQPFLYEDTYALKYSDVLSVRYFFGVVSNFLIKVFRIYSIFRLSFFIAAYRVSLS